MILSTHGSLAAATPDPDLFDGRVAQSESQSGGAVRLRVLAVRQANRVAVSLIRRVVVARQVPKLEIPGPPVIAVVDNLLRARVRKPVVLGVEVLEVRAARFRSRVVQEAGDRRRVSPGETPVVPPVVEVILKRPGRVVRRVRTNQLSVNLKTSVLAALGRESGSRLTVRKKVASPHQATATTSGRTPPTQTPGPATKPPEAHKPPPVASPATTAPTSLPDYENNSRFLGKADSPRSGSGSHLRLGADS